MDHASRLRLCDVCRHRRFDLKRGVLCGLSGERPAFEGHCPDHEADPDKLRAAHTPPPVRHATERRPLFTWDRRSTAIALSLGVGVLAFAFFIHLYREHREQQVLHVEFERFANEIAAGINEGRPETIDTAIHHATLFATAARQLGLASGVWDRRLLEQFAIGAQLVQFMDADATFELVDLTIEGRTAKALYRTLGSTGMAHHELTLVGHKGRPYVGDVYNFSNGMLLSAAIAEPGLLAKRMGNRVLSDFSKARILYPQLINGAQDEVWDALLAMDPAVRRTGGMRQLYMDAASFQGDSVYAAVVNELFEAVPDPRFHAYRGFALAQDLYDAPASLRALDQLQPFLAADPWLDVLRSRVLFQAGDSAAAWRMLDHAVARDPFQEVLQVERLEALARAGFHAQALEQADTLVLLFGYGRSDIADYFDSIPGLDTSRALYHWRYGE